MNTGIIPFFLRKLEITKHELSELLEFLLEVIRGDLVTDKLDLLVNIFLLSHFNNLFLCLFFKLLFELIIFGPNKERLWTVMPMLTSSSIFWSVSSLTKAIWTTLVLALVISSTLTSTIASSSFEVPTLFLLLSLKFESF